MQSTQTGNSWSLGRLLSSSAVFSYVFCLMASQTLVHMPLLGGALFMLSQIATLFFTGYAGVRRRELPRDMRRWHTALLALLLLLSLFVLVVYPAQVATGDLWVLFALVLAMLIRDGLGERLLQVNAVRPFRRGWLAAWVACLHLAPALVILWILLTQLPRESAWYLTGGYLVTGLLSFYSQAQALRHQRAPAADDDPERLGALHEALSHTNTFHVYETLSFLVVAAVEMTMALLYTWVAVNAEQTLIRIALAVGVTLACRWGARSWLRWRSQRKRRVSDRTNILLVGLFLWLFGLNSFRRAIGEDSELVTLYVCLALSTAGATLCLSVLSWLEEEIAQVAAFTVGGETAGYSTLRETSLRLAALVGQMAALAALAVSCFAAAGRLPFVSADAALAFRPILVLPALLTLVGAVVFTFRFPLSTTTFQKLSRFLRMQEDNPPLRAQLNRKLVEKYRQPFATRAIKAGIRTLFRHRLLHPERIVPDPDNPIIFLCNHGDLYGPMISVSYLPVHVRPWSISSIMEEEAFEYIYKYTFSQNRHVPRPLRRPCARLVSGLSVWCMRQLECIPVYREQPTRLMRTFRASVEALQSGDNLLIFPENPNAAGQDHGYETSGLGELFTGFTMLAPIYYKRTGKACRFLPMYASKRARTIAFGQEIIYRPGEDTQGESLRITREAGEQMLALMREAEAKLNREAR